MKNRFTIILKFLIFLVLILGLYMVKVNAQEYKGGILEGTIRIKLNPTLGEAVRITTANDGKTIHSGITALDKLNTEYAVVNMKRVFPYSPKFEEKHQKYGLNLWYELTYSTKTSSNEEIIKSYDVLQEISNAEPILERGLIQPGKAVYVDLNTIKSTKAEPFNDPYLPGQWHYNNTGQTGGTAGEDIRLYNAWAITTGSSDVIVSIHDQGVDVDHEDLADAMWVNEAELNGEPNVDDDGNGYKDDIYGFNFGDNMGDIPGEYHATHVAGTVGAVNNNGKGVAGVAGGSGSADGVRIMACRILGGTGGGNIPDSYVYAADNGAIISQNSWGYTTAGAYEQVVLDAMDYFIAEAGSYDGSPMKGGVVICAAGNDNTNGIHYPGAYENVICVSALSAFAVKASYSNYGYWVDIAAPGGETGDDINVGDEVDYSNGILSCFENDAYGYLDGTSMACPHVSGVAALVVSKHGGAGFTSEDLKAHLLTGVRDIYEIEGNLNYIDSLGLGYSDALLSLATDNGIAPKAITDLSIASLAQDFANLQWTVHTDEDDYLPYEFEVIYSTEVISLATMDYAKTIRFRNLGGLGEAVSYEVHDLSALTNYNFAVRSLDRWGNISDFSNIVNATTNAGPDAEIDSTDLSVDITIDITVDTFGVDSFKLFNYGEGLLRWDALSRHISSEPLSVKPAWDYPIVKLSSLSSPKGFRTITYDNVLNPAPFNVEDENDEELHYCNDWFNFWVIGETDTSYTNSTATRFYVENSAGFNLTNVDVVVNHDETTGPIILEVYLGENISEAELLLAQEIEESASFERGVQWTHIELSEQIYLEQGSTFWIVYHVPSGNEYPLGASLESEKSASENCYISLNMGKTWTLFEDAYYDNQIVWSVVAMSNYLQLDEYITLTPDQGDIASMDSTFISTSVNASNMINGDYQGNIVINTNETGEPMVRIPVNVIIKGHLPVISSEKRIDFGSIIYGNEKTLEVTLKNEGLGKFYSPVITSISDAQFEYVTGLKTMESGGEITIAFKYVPSAAGTAYAIAILTDDDGVEHKIELVGVAAEPPVARLNPSEETFSNLAIGDTVNGSFYLVNDGNYPLDYYLPMFADGSNMTETPEDIHKFGYRASYDTLGVNPAYVWDDISTSGTNITENLSGAYRVNVFHKLDIGFEFPFFGTKEDSLYITRYGVVSFDDEDYIFARWPMGYKHWYNPNRYIGAYGLQMNFSEALFGDVYYQRYMDKFVVQYENVPWESGESGYLTLQIVLHDNGNINIYYKEVDVQGNEWWDPFYFVMIAIEDQNQDDGLLIHNFEHRNFDLKGGSAIEFINPGNGLYTDVTNPYGTILQSDSILIEYQLETEELNVENYTESIVAITNDPFNNPAIYSAHLELTSGGVAEIHATDSVLDYSTVFQNDVKEISLNFVNIGRATDSLLSANFDNDNFYIYGNNIPEVLKPGRTLYYTIGINTPTLGSYEDTLRITTKEGQLFKIALSGEIIAGPDISIDPTSISKNMIAGTRDTVLLTISNPGDFDLDVAPVSNHAVIIEEKLVKGTKETTVPEFTYDWKRSDEENGPVYDWIEIAEGEGTKLEGLDPYFGPHWTEGIELPFTFNYYGNDYDTIYIGYSGLVSFTGGQEADWLYGFGGYLIPMQSMPNNYIAPLWVGGGTDWAVAYPNTGQYYKIEEDKIIVEYRDYINGFSMGYPVSFQVILYSNGNIKFQYKMPEQADLNFTTSQGNIGVENADGTEGVQLSYNEKWINSDVAVGLYPVEKYVIPVGGSKDFDVVIDASESVEGPYNYDIELLNNAPSGLGLTLPVTINIAGYAEVVIPDSLYFGDILISETESNSLTQEFELENTGTAKYVVTGLSQNLPVDVYIEALILTPNLITGEDEWLWKPISDGVTPQFIYARTLLEMRVTINPDTPINLNDTLTVTTSAGVFQIPIIAEAFLPPVIDTDLDLIEVYAHTSDHSETRTFVLNNIVGGYDLDYSITIDYDRQQTTDIQPVDYSSYTQESESLELFENAISTKSEQATKAYNRVMAHDTASYPESALGYGGGASFHTATAFVAPVDGFNLTHVQTWFAAGDWLNGDITVNIYGGSTNIYNCELVHSQEYVYSITEQDMNGELITIELTENIVFYPNETFFIEFGYDAGSTYPQGVVSGLEPVENRFLYGQGDSWNDLVGSGYDDYGWMTRAVEEVYQSSVWVLLESESTGTVVSGSNNTLSLNFDALYANPGDNYADLHIWSNDPLKEDKVVTLLLKKNQAPIFDLEDLAFTVSENDQLNFKLTAIDLEGDNFTLSISESYSFVNATFSNDTLNITCNPTFDDDGVYTLTVIGVDELGNTSETTVLIGVINANRAPEANIFDPIELYEDGDNYYINVTELFTDADGDDISIVSVSNSDDNVAIIYESGNEFVIIPGLVGTDTISFTATDSYGAETINNIVVTVLKQTTTGIENILSGTMNVYPNPTNGELFITLPDINDSELTITIINTMGNIVKNLKISNTYEMNHKIDITDLSNGIYFIKVVGDTYKNQQKIIKK